VVGQGASYLEPLLLPVLGVAMTFSTMSIANRNLISLKTMPRPVLISLLLNYVAMGGVMLLMARWLIGDAEIWAGFVVLAAIPPAVGVMPFSYILKGNLTFSLLGLTGLYLVALGLTPGLTVLLLGADLIDPARLLIILVELIVIPLVVSRVLLFTGLSQRIIGWQDTAVKWCFFVTIYIIIGLNRQVFFGQPDVLLKVFIICAVASFVLGHTVYFVARQLKMDQATGISWMVMSTKKNAGLASAVAITLIGERAAFPAGVLVVFDVLTVVWWTFYFRKWVR